MRTEFYNPEYPYQTGMAELIDGTPIFIDSFLSLSENITVHENEDIKLLLKCYIFFEKASFDYIKTYQFHLKFSKEEIIQKIFECILGYFEDGNYEEEECKSDVINFIEENKRILTYRNKFGTLLHLACGDGYLELVKILLEYCGMNINSTRSIYKSTPIHFAILSECKSVINYLIDRGADLFIKDDDGEFPYEMMVRISGMDDVD